MMEVMPNFSHAPTVRRAAALGWQVIEGGRSSAPSTQRTMPEAERAALADRRQMRGARQ
jgi:hypothetical protein